MKLCRSQVEMALCMEVYLTSNDFDVFLRFSQKIDCGLRVVYDFEGTDGTFCGY